MKTYKLSRDDYTRFMKNIDGARDEVKKSYFEAWGPCRLAAPSGRFVAMVREAPGEDGDDNAIETQGEEAGPKPQAEEVSERTMRAQADSIKRQRASGLTNRAPSPKSCKCRDWPASEGEHIEHDDKGKPLSHRRACAWRTMYERQTGSRIKNVPAGPTFEAKIHKAGKVSNPSVTKPTLMGKPGAAKNVKQKVVSIPRPDNCPKCAQFTKNKKMLAEEQQTGSVQHHPICEYYKKYKALSHAQKHAGVTPKPVAAPPQKKSKAWLYDLESQEAVREAEPDEVMTARRSLRDGGDDGIAIVEVDGRSYLVMLEDGSSLEPAAPEAAPERRAEPAQSSPLPATEVSDTEPPPPTDEEEEEGEEDADPTSDELAEQDQSTGTD